jgi:hypothetical protein
MKVSDTTEEDCKSMGWNFHCIGCARPWPSATSLKYHELKCRPAQQAIITNPNKRWAGKWEVEEVLAVRGPPGNRFWHVKWKGWAGRAGTDGTANTDWEPERNLAPAMFNALKPSFAKMTGKMKQRELDKEGLCAKFFRERPHLDPTSQLENYNWD